MLRLEKSCEVCRSRPASLILVRRRRNELTKNYVCKHCAGERTRLFAGTNLNLRKIVSAMSGDSSKVNATSYSCKVCSMTLAQIVVEGKPGCCYCYTRFQNEIEPTILSMQNHTHHVGKTPEL